ncbi:hypothetical protein NDN08_000436 [Rhodosorus marinus]|uniref:Uncharacterized protein n=1 Tax=Rhodosorus marinus TaxID=101924 RepID=A0AAV8UMV9_9RHOD|nr:hypothetical protein NDN08_000436 [Rhodosorus marinus]
MLWYSEKVKEAMSLEENAKVEENVSSGKNWTLWYDNAAGLKDTGSGFSARGRSRSGMGKVDLHNWESFLHNLSEIDSIDTFWALFNCILEPSKLPRGSNYHFFRTGVEPKWEDKFNEAGGKWVLTIPKGRKDLLDIFWLHLVLAVVGEVFPPTAANDIAGIVTSVRKNQDRIALWTCSALNVELQELIGKSWSALACPGGLPVGFTLEYQVHKDAMAKTSSFYNKVRYSVRGDSPPI